MYSYFSLRMPVELKDRLSNEAKSKGISINALILQILWSY